MKKLIILFIITLGLIVPAKGYGFQRDNWRIHEIFLQGIFTGLTIADLMQTYTFLYTEPYKSQGHIEKNPFLGKHPSKTKFFILGTTGILVHAGISHGLHYLPTKINKFLIPAWQMLYIGVELKAINHNYIAGIRINF